MLRSTVLLATILMAAALLLGLSACQATKSDETAAAAATAPAGTDHERWQLAQRLRDQTHRALRPSRPNCMEYAKEYYKRLSEKGIPVRLVFVQATPLNNFDTHAFVEVQTQGRWVISDPTFNGTWKVNGRLAGTADIQEGLRNGTWRDVRWQGPQTLVRDYRVDPRILMRFAQYSQQLPDGTWTGTGSALVESLGPLYYASSQRPANSDAGILVVRGGSSWRYRGWVLGQLPDGRFVSPIIAGLPRGAVRPEGKGHGDTTVMWVPRYS